MSYERLRDTIVHCSGSHVQGASIFIRRGMFVWMKTWACFENKETYSDSDTNQVIIIDTDTGQSGAESSDRKGFQKLVSEVGMGQAGIVMGLEVSRLARNCADWHRLIEICALAGTLLLDEDGIYDPGSFNDRLLLGLKGTMSEAELHVLRARLRGGVLNKAKRGELKLTLPVGFIYEGERVMIDPNSQVQESIRFFFKTFEYTGSAYLTVKAFSDKGLKFPKRLQAGTDKGNLIWVEMNHARAVQILHNPRYAGVFFTGELISLKDQIDTIV
jgi:DNA invertase Pin-like site-specific DNA recombinase